MKQRALAGLNLRDAVVIDLDIDRTPSQPITIPISIDGQAFTLALLPHSVRSPNYRLRAQLADGTYETLDPGPVRTLRGSLLEVPGSQATGGLLEDGLHVMVRMPDGERRWIQPIGEFAEEAGPEKHVMYRDEDVICSGGQCGSDAAFIMANPPAEVVPPEQGGTDGGGTDGATVHCTEIAIDADVEFHNLYGGVTGVENRVNLVITTMNNQYINEVDIQHVITDIIVRTAEPDPYSSTSAGTLLSQFANHWQSSQGSVPRDVAELFTGKNMDGSTIGIAYLSGICNDNGYSVVMNQGSLGCATDLSAHELGHNWSAQHCSSSCSSTMNSGLMCVNTFNNSSPDSAAQIVAFRNTRTCLGACADATLPFFDDFPVSSFDTAKWASIIGATVSTTGSNEPSAPNSMRLRGSSGGGHQARTARINTANLGILQMSYYYQRTGGGNQPEPGEDLLVEFYNPSGNWVEVSRQLGNGPAMSTFVQANVNFPPEAYHSEFRVRFRNLSGNNNADDWFVDNVSITGVGIPANNNCANATAKGSGAHAFTTVASTTDGPNEPGSCNFGGYTHLENDVWFKIIAQCTGNMTVSLCGASYNAKVAAYPSCPVGAGSTIACNDDFCGNAPEITFPVVSGTIYLVRIGGFNGATGSGTMVVSCTPVAPPACPEDLSDDDIVGVPDLLALINAWGPCPGCPADLNDDDVVGVPDLLQLINSWGACPN